jgi:hypothetical protein
LRQIKIEDGGKTDVFFGYQVESGNFPPRLMLLPIWV